MAFDTASFRSARAIEQIVLKCGAGAANSSLSICAGPTPSIGCSARALEAPQAETIKAVSKADQRGTFIRENISNLNGKFGPQVLVRRRLRGKLQNLQPIHCGRPLPAAMLPAHPIIEPAQRRTPHVDTLVTEMHSILLTLSLTLGVLVTGPAAAHATQLACDQPATTLTGEPGATVEVTCPAGCADAIVWGSGPYTDDSSICVAAIHAGTITSAGGSFTVTIAGAGVSFPGSTANDVTTHDWAEWGRSFTTNTAGGYPILDCFVSAQQLESGNYLCPAGCSVGGTVWGTGPYTDDSAICRAAIHAGASRESGRTVYLDIVPGQESYDGGTNNAVTTSPYGPWQRSFSFRVQ